MPSGNSAHDRALVTAALVGEAVIYRFEDARHPGNLWMAKPGATESKQLTNTNAVFANHVLGDTRLIEWLNDDGVKRRGALLLPAGFQEGQRYPLVVWVYGSAVALSDSINNFGLESPWNNLHLLATRGYAVLMPDSETRVGTPMLDIAKNVLPGVNKVIDMGIADGDRLGVIGHSYGGYSALSLIVQTTRFKAAVCFAGISDLVSYYGSKFANGVSEGVQWAEKSQGRMGGSPWEFRERYLENSPLLYLDRVTTPLLLIHGDLDPVPVSQADQVFIALQRLGKTVSYARYADVGHSFTDYPNLVDYWKRVIAWFDKHLASPMGAAQ